MSPIVNTEVKMPQRMLEALTLHETYCVMSSITKVNESEVRQWLLKNFDQNMSDEFSSDYLFNTQVS
jgi:hypothetical protein